MAETAPVRVLLVEDEPDLRSSLRYNLKSAGYQVTDAVNGMLTFYDRNDPERYGEPGAPLHDPCVIAWLLQPDLFRGKEVHLAVETASPLTMGRTLSLIHI